MPHNYQLPEWKNLGQEPTKLKKEKGWAPLDRPPAEWLNWLFNRTYVALKEIQERGISIDELMSLSESLDTKIGVKADLSYVETMLASAISGAPKGVYTTLNALTAAYPQGTDGVFLVLESGHIYIWNGSAWADAGVYQGIVISNESLTYEKTTFVTTGKNLFDVDACSLNGLNVSTGQPTENADFLLTPYTFVRSQKNIYVSTYSSAYSKQIAANLIYRLCYYDANYKFLGTIAPASNLGTEYVVSGTTSFASAITIPSSAVYVRYMVPLANRNDKIQVEYDKVTDAYEPFGYNIPKLSLNRTLKDYATQLGQVGQDISQLKDDLEDIIIDPEQTTFIDTTLGKNLLDQANMVIGNISSNGVVSPDNTSSYIYTPKKSVTPGKTIFLSKTYKATGAVSALTFFRVYQFDENGGYLGYVGDTSNWISQYKVPSGVYYVILRSATSNFDFNSYNYQLEYDTMTPYEPYGKKYQLNSQVKIAGIPHKTSELENDKNFVTQEDIGSMQSKEDLSEISGFGDSLSDGTGASSSTTNYLAVLQSKLGNNYTVQNCGIGGEGAANIAMRQGGIPFYVNPFTIPADSTPVKCTLRNRYTKSNVSLFRRGGAYVDPNYDHLRINPVVINGVEGTLSRPDVSTYDYTFTRTTPGEAITFTRPEFVNTYANRKQRSHTAIIWAGTNDTTKTVDYIIQIQQNMVDNLTHNNYIIIGLTSKSYHSDIINKNSAMSEYWGKRFLDIRDYLLEYGLSDAGISPTSQDTTDISNGEIPTSLRVDTVHFNDAGYSVIANQVYKKGKELGYWA